MIAGYPGRVEPGSGIAAGLIPGRGLDWSPLGYQPYPGTLNVRVGQNARWALIDTDPLELHGWQFWPVDVSGVAGHIVRTREPAGVQIVAPVMLRIVLGVSDGDEVIVAARKAAVPW